MEMLSNGSRGDAVKALQGKLQAMGLNPGTVDGVFGPKTDQAVRRYQEQKGLQVDGIAGPETFTSLGMMGDDKPAAVETVRQPEPTEASVAPQAPPAQPESSAPSGIEAMRSAEEKADDKPSGVAPKGLRARMAARREARRNRDR
jgi:peptidoglycan hydrolase-like protein with peptidoglycan-binding domain